MSTLSTAILKSALKECALTLGDLRNYLPPNCEFMYDSFCKGVNSVSTVEFAKKDFRFSCLCLKNFRKFASLPDNEYFGLEFMDDVGGRKKKLNFICLLGDNGVGKSSLVDAMELMFTGNIGEAIVRNIPPNSYIANVSGKPVVKVKTNSALFDFDDENAFVKSFCSEYDVSNFFFSENSIINFAKYTRKISLDTNNWYSFFCYMLGLGSLVDACGIDGLLSQIKVHIGKIKEELGSEKIEVLRNELEKFIRDSGITVTDKQKVFLNRLSVKLKGLLEQIEKKKITSLPVLSSYFKNTDFLYEKQIYFIREFHSLCDDLTNIRAEIPSSSKATGMKLKLKENQPKNSMTLEDMRKGMEICCSHINNVLGHGMGEIPLKEIERRVKVLQRREQFARGHAAIDLAKTTEDLEQLVVSIDKLKDLLLSKIHDAVVEYVDDAFVKATKEMFGKTFITLDEKELSFDISELKTNEQINISVKNVPVHKYFNTFRYRLFCLTLQAMVNIKVMQKEQFSFPFVLDDVFYANDYRNKQEVYRYFEQIRNYAELCFKDSKEQLQIIFFTHDEQIISCFSTKLDEKSLTLVKLLQPDFAKMVGGKGIALDSASKEKFYNLYFKLYE